MTTRKRPSLRDNMSDGEDTARQLEQAAEIERRAIREAEEVEADAASARKAA